MGKKLTNRNSTYNSNDSPTSSIRLKYLQNTQDTEKRKRQHTYFYYKKFTHNVCNSNICTCSNFNHCIMIINCVDKEVRCWISTLKY